MYDRPWREIFTLRNKWALFFNQFFPLKMELQETLLDIDIAVSLLRYGRVDSAKWLFYKFGGRIAPREPCYSRHVILFLPVVHSFEELVLVQHREHDGGPFRDRRCYRRFIIARRPRTLVEIGFLHAGRNFLFFPGGASRAAMASVFVIGRPFNRLKCIVRSSCRRSHFRRR